jgi:hypothetical protein
VPLLLWTAYEQGIAVDFSAYEGVIADVMAVAIIPTDKSLLWS